MHFWTTGSNMETVVYLYGFAKRHPPSSSSGTSPLLFSEAGMTVLTLFVFRFGRMVRRGFSGGSAACGARGGGAVAEGPWRRGRGAESGGVTMGWSWFSGIAETVTSCNSSGKAIAILRASRAYQLARWHRFVSIERLEPLQTALQGTFARAMLCRKITEDQRPATHGPQSPVPHFPAIHLAPESAFQGPPGHISSRDGIDLCPSSAANPSRQRYKAHSLAR